MSENDYQELLRKFEQSGGNPRLLFSFRSSGPTEYAKQKLVYELGKLGIRPKSAPVIREEKTEAAAEPTPATAALEPLPDTYGTVPVGLPEEVEKLEKEWRIRYKKASHYLSVLRDPVLDYKDRNYLAQNRMDEIELVYGIWQQLDFWRVNGYLPNVLQPAPPETVAQLGKLDRDQLVKLDETHRKYISKYRDDENKADEVAKRALIRAAITKILEA